MKSVRKFGVILALKKSEGSSEKGVYVRTCPAMFLYLAYYDLPIFLRTFHWSKSKGTLLDFMLSCAIRKAHYAFLVFLFNLCSNAVSILSYFYGIFGGSGFTIVVLFIKSQVWAILSFESFPEFFRLCFYNSKSLNCIGALFFFQDLFIHFHDF